MQKVCGKISRVNGPVIEIKGIKDLSMLELVEAGQDRIIGEVMRISRDKALVQLYEDTTGLKPDDEVYGTGMPLSVELGPGMIGEVYDGIQRPLNKIRDISGIFITRGVHVNALDRERLYNFKPLTQKGSLVGPGDFIGEVSEHQIMHKIMVPPDISGKIVSIAAAGEYNIEKEITEIETENGIIKLKMYHKWSIRKPRPYKSKLELDIPLITGQRVIDTLFPIPKGGTAEVPGGFGTGKTLTQQAIAKWCDADIIIYIGCGERGNEMTDVLRSFPELVDPKSGKSLMERTILVANTSNMPVAAREACIYTGITIAEYYRDMGYDIAIMADSTSRWAEALRELSGRMEEMPADEGFPAYMPTRLAEYYERAGRVETNSGVTGSITAIGAVSPPGGDFSEPVTQHTKRFVRCFWALDRHLANARHYPAISWLDSYSEYLDEISEWWQNKQESEWSDLRSAIMTLLQKEMKLQRVVKLVGPDALPESQRFILEVCNLFKNSFLQQSAFDKIDMYSTLDKQIKMLKIIVKFYEKGADLIKKGATINKIKRINVYPEILRMKFTVSNDETDILDDLLKKMDRSLQRLLDIYSRPVD